MIVTLSSHWRIVFINSSHCTTYIFTPPKELCTLKSDFDRGLVSRSISAFRYCPTCWSFYFYIPHKRPKPGGRTSSYIRRFTPSLDPKVTQKAAESNSQVLHSQHSYGILRGYYPFHDIVILHTFFHSFILYFGCRGTLSWVLVDTSIIELALPSYSHTMYYILRGFLL